MTTNSIIDMFGSESSRRKVLGDKVSNDVVADSLIGVRLDRDREILYNSVIFPAKKISGRSPHPTRLDHYNDIMVHIGKVNRALNSLFSMHRMLMEKAGILDTIPADQRNSMIAKIMESKASDTWAVVEQEAVTKFQERIVSGKMHVITPSTSGDGYDIDFIGTPMVKDRESTTINIPDLLGEVTRRIPTDERAAKEYDEQQFTKYKSDIGKKVLKSAKMIFAFLNGHSVHSPKITVNNAHKRTILRFPLNTDFEKLNTILQDNLGIDLNLQTKLFKNIPSELVRGLSKFVSILFVYEARDFVVDQINSNMRRASEIQETDAAEFQEPDTTRIITDEGYHTDPLFSSSISVHLPEDICRFITQTPDSERIPVYILHSWVRIWSSRVLKKKGARVKGASRLEGGRTLPIRKLPRYILPASRVGEISKIRKDNKYYVEPGRNDDQGLSVSKNGTVHFYPKENEIPMDETKNYEQSMNILMEYYYERGIPVDLERTTIPSVKHYNVFNNTLTLVEDTAVMRKTLDKYKGVLIAYSWDYDTVLNVNLKDPTKFDTVNITGTTKLKNVEIADYLGMDLGDGEPKSFKKAMSLILRGNYNLRGEMYSEEDFEHPHAMLGNTVFKTFMIMYNKLHKNGRVKSFQEYLDQAKKYLSLTTLTDTVEDGIYYQTLSNDMVVNEGAANNLGGHNIFMCLSAAMTTATGRRGTSLRRSIEEAGALSEEAINSELEDHPMYFEPSRSTMSSFGNVYNLLGGRIFKFMLEDILSIPKAKLLASQSWHGADDHDSDDGYPSFIKMSREVLPVMIIFNHYVPKALDIFEKATEELEQYVIEQDMDVDDIKIPGMKAGTQFFPHQVKSHSVLRKRPFFAIMDIDPGGGKTMLSQTDAMSCVKEMMDLGVRIKPLVIAPDGLVVQWCDELVKICGSTWNVVPITTSVFREWGQDRIEEILEKAPINTIVVVGMSFLKSKQIPITIGYSSIPISGGLEMIKKYGFDYIVIDESHKLKNPDAVIHHVVKQLTTSSNIKFLRLATGTLISNTLTDVVGQSALATSHVFRTKGEYEDENQVTDTNIQGDKVQVWLDGTASNSRKKLSKYSAVITMKKKEWAFMLPTPVESFYGISLADDKNYDREGELHQEVYNAVLDKSIAELTRVLGTKSKSDDDDDDDDDSGTTRRPSSDDDDESDAEEDMEFDVNDELAGLESLLKPWISRLEQILTDPLGDPVGKEIFRHAGVEKFVSNKVKQVIKLIDQHFQIEEWQKAKTYRELDLVKFGDKNYLLRKLDTFNMKRQHIEPNGLDPATDTDRWKFEPDGKILIFCRYNRSTEAIYNALPEKYKAMTRVINSKSNLQKAKYITDFKSDNKVQILIANEQGMSEGHNLQVASRMIRVEMPWAPGALDQSSSRIFRPDPSAAKNMAADGKPGELNREVVFLDWIMANNTLEVSKFARLMEKIVSKTRFDEEGNPNYAEIKEIRLEPIRMKISTLQMRPALSHMSDYTGAYANVQSIRSNEFREMRRSNEVRMYDITPEPPLPGSEYIDIVPTLPDQIIADPHNFGLIRARDFLDNDNNIEYKRNPTSLVGLPVKTQFGTGVVVGVRTKLIDNEFGVREINEDDPISTIQVRLSGTDDLISLPYSKIYFATNVTEENKNLFTTKKPWANDTQKKRIIKELTRRKAKKERTEEDDTAKTRREKIKALRDAERRDLMKERAKKRKANIKEGKDVNSDIQEVTKLPLKPLKGGKRMTLKPKHTDTVIEISDMEENLVVDIEPIVYNGFLTVAVDGADPDAKNLKSLGFRWVGDYAYIYVRNVNHFYAFLDYVEEKGIVLSTATAKRLEQVQDFFEDSKTFKYRADLSDASQLAQFFRTAHRKVKSIKEMKIYPVVLEDKLMLSVDIETSPGAKRLIGKKIPSIPASLGTWKKSPGLALNFVRSKTEAKKVLRLLKREGYTVNNEAHFLAELEKLKVKRAKP